MPNLTENTKVLILSKLEGWSIRRVAQYNNIAKSTVQRIKQTNGVLKYLRRFMLSNLPNLFKYCGGREKVGKSKMLIFQGNDSKFHIIPKIL
jgi:hypothetical protein